MSEKRETREDAEGVVLQSPCDRAKATLPEPQSSVVEPSHSPLQRLGAVLAGAHRYTFAVCTLRLTDDEQRVY